MTSEQHAVRTGGSSASGGGADPLAVARDLSDAEAWQLLQTASAAAGAELRGLRLRNVHERARRSVSRVYDATLGVGEQERPALLVVHADARGHPDGALVLSSDAGDVAVWRFPHDPYLPGLASAVHRERVRELLARLGGPDGAVRLATRAYRPSRRAVVEVAVADGDASARVLYLKVLAGRRAAEVAGIHRQLAEVLPVPRVVGVSAEQGIVALQALGGETLRSAVLRGGRLPDPRELVAMSRRLASSDLRSRRDPRAFADPTRHVPLLQRLVPDRAEEVARLAGEAAEVDGPPVPVHGDLHDGQLLLTDGRVTGLLDVDGAGHGLLAQEAGTLVAHLAVLGHVQPEVAGRADAYAAAVADAYRRLVGDEALRRATAGAWLALATGPHRAQDRDWPGETRRRLDRAGGVLTGRDPSAVSTATST